VREGGQLVFGEAHVHDDAEAVEKRGLSQALTLSFFASSNLHRHYPELLRSRDRIEPDCLLTGCRYAT
jgi:hypothetical protein